VFRDPVVKRAFSVAATAFAFEAQLKFNAKTAIILADLRLDANTVAATLLYDAVRTSSVTHHQLPQLLPPDVTSIVNAAARIDHTCALLRTDNVKVCTFCCVV
jgi:(p)ppGpp synthase/HD superfamily hydrolase